MWLYSWKYGSRGARALAEQLGAKRIRHEGSRFIGRPRKVVINWGSTQLPDEVLRATVLNNPIRLRFVTDKLKFLRLVSKKTVTPDWTDDKLVAKEWQKDGHTVVCRTILNGHSGAGIDLRGPDDYLILAPLYTKYVPKMSEFRVHFVGDKIIDIQRKAARNNFPKEQINWQVRNADGGFVYVRNNVICPQRVKDNALAAFKVTGLHFGAVDVIWNQKKKEAFVLEVNTAPGLEGQTVVNYSNAFQELEKELMQ